MISDEALEVQARLNKKYGKGAVVVASDMRTYPKITTGSLGLDIALQGGWASNQWHEVYGNPSDGKTGLAYATIRANQAINPDFTVAWVASEPFYAPYAEMCGVDTSQVILVETNIMEDAYGAVIDYIDSKSVDLVVIDSYPALVPALEDGKDVGELSPGRGAFLTNQFFRKVGKVMRRSSETEERAVTGLLLNQWRMKIGISFGDPRTVPGGMGKDFACFTRLELARDEWIEGGSGKERQRIGQTVRATTKKSKSSPRERKALYDIYFDKGGPVPPGRIDYAKELVTEADLQGIVDKAGNWFTYEGMRFNGRQSFADGLRELPDLMNKLDREVRRTITAPAELVP